MRRITSVVAGLTVCAAVAGRAGAQTDVPSTDVVLAPLSVANGRVTVGTPINVTRRPGYDNQPSFTPDGRAILYTSIRADGQADTYRYDLTTRATTRVTNTPESEYSPTVMPGGDRFSVIRVEADSTQRLWSFAMDGSDPRLMIAGIKPVGYHLWLNDHQLALFVLGSPNALVAADSRGGRADTLARDIGRSLVLVPGSDGFTYLQHEPSGWALTRVEPGSGATPRLDRLVAMPRGADYVVWLGPDIALTAAGSSLLEWRRGQSSWSPVADLGSAGLRHLSRLAVSGNGEWLAVVAEPAAP
jgi:hypothetical protein